MVHSLLVLVLNLLQLFLNDPVTDNGEIGPPPWLLDLGDKVEQGNLLIDKAHFFVCIVDCNSLPYPSFGILTN